MSTAMVELDGLQPQFGVSLRAALTLAAVRGRPFSVRQIRALAAQPGLRPEHTAAVRAAGWCCQARVHGAFDGSPDLRFEPQRPAPGEYAFELPGAAAAPLVLEVVVPILAAAPGPSQVTVVGGTHVPEAPCGEYFTRQWLAAARRAGLEAEARLEQVGYHPAGQGTLVVQVETWRTPEALDLRRRGKLVAVRGVFGQAHLPAEVAGRMKEACRALLWEERRLDSEWEPGPARAASPGAYLYLEALFETSRAAFWTPGERGSAPEALGARLARRLLRFLDDEPQVPCDPWLADQWLVPLALAGSGARLGVPDVTPALLAVAQTLRTFGAQVEVSGRRGGPGELRVAPWEAALPC